MHDVTRKEYRALSDLEVSLIAKFKDLGNEFIGFANNYGSSREMSIAKTKMEEAVMWAVKGVTG